MRRCLLYLLLCSLASTGLHADGPAFDLTGPKIDVHVKRGNVTLPISEAPNLLPGDRLWIHPDLPESQSTHFVLVVAFLRGATNPPPPEWFTRVETWNREARDEGVFVTVPKEAQHALIFLAPETGGDFNTLRKAVHDRPGVFIRAAQDLQAASWDRMRVESFLSQVKVTSQTDPKSLKEHAQLAARSLGIKLNQACFEKPSEQQVSCLSQNSTGIVLDDSNAQSLVAQLTNGSTQDLMNQLSYSPMGGGGAYSPYIGAIVDTARILSSLHTAHFQYIPALALPTEDTLNLRLNMPPSFRNPKSVVVVALPPLGPAKPEPLHPVAPSDDFCAQKPGLVLPAEGAPLVFASQLAHDLTLHIETRSNSKRTSIDLPVVADPAKGGLILKEPAPALPPGELIGVIRGKWGFDDWTGPQFRLLSSQPGGWTLASADQSALVVGREDTLHFEGQNTLCVERVEEQASAGGPRKLTWKSPKPGTLDVAVPMKDAAPGPVTVSIFQYGLEKPESVAMTAYADAASLDRLTLSAGDPDATLKGTRLDEVAKAELDGLSFTPSTLSRAEDRDQLVMKTAAATSRLQPGKQYFARVVLKDGRLLKAPVTVDPPRPQATLLSKGVQEDATAATPSPVQLGSPDDLPLEGRLVFFLKSTVPARFARNEKVELGAADGSFDTELSLADGSLMLEDATTAMGSVEPLTRFGASAFGPIRVRVRSADGATGDWLPLGTLVRIPGFKELRCPRAVAKPCTLSGTNLFLAASISATPDFDDPTDVPPDFTGTQLTVPHPVNGILYLKLRDDPVTVQTLTLPLTPALPLASEAAAARTRPAPTQPAEAPAAAPPTTTPPAVTPPAVATPSTTPPAATGSSSAPRTGTSKPVPVAPAAPVTGEATGSPAPAPTAPPASSPAKTTPQ
jgi:hypothetical protein